MKKKLLGLSLMMLSGMSYLHAQTARVQVIHNCADAVADSVDVYLNGTLLLDNFAFRTATPFVNVAAGQNSLAIAPKTSMSVADAIYTVSPTLMQGSTYIVVAEGIVSQTGYSPAPAFGLNVYGMGRETGASGTNTDVLVHHGSTDAPTVDVRSGGSALVDDIAYGQFSNGYVSVPTDDYTINITDAAGTTTVASYAAPLQTLGLNGEALVVVASGFLNPANNSNGPAFGLYAAPATGGDLVRLPLSPRLQVIHNCADAVADSVDVYVNGSLLLDNFAFRTATPFVDAPYGTVSVAVAPKTSTSVADAIYTASPTLNPDETYIVTAQGIVSATGYSPAPAFSLNVYNMAQESAATNVDVLVHHGSTDAPVVDVRSGSTTLVNDIAYGQYSNGYLNLPVSNYTLDITDATGNTVVARYSAPLQTLGLQNQALTVLASGFLNPANNSNGPAFGLYVALATGGALVPLPVVPVSVNDVVAKETIRMYPNPANTVINIDHTDDKGDIRILDITGKEVLNGTGLRIDISSLEQGMYMLHYTTGNADLTGRFVKF